MNQKSLKPLMASNLSLPSKNTILCFEDSSNPPSHPISTDSPYARRDVEARHDNFKPIESRKVAPAKLAMLLEAQNTKEKEPPTMKSVSQIISMSPQNKRIKSLKNLEVVHILPESNKKSPDAFKDKMGHKVNPFNDVLGGSQSEKNYYLGAQFGDTEKLSKPRGEQKKNRYRADSSDAKDTLGTSGDTNKETKRVRKSRKGHKNLSIGNFSQQQILNHLSYNLSLSPENSLFIGAMVSTTHKSKKEVKSPFDAHPVPFNSPRKTFFNSSNSHREESTPCNSQKDTIKKNNNTSIHDSVVLDQKAYLNFNASLLNRHQCQRKVGSTSANTSNIFGKSFSKGGKRGVVASPKGSSISQGFKIIKSPSRNVSSEKKDVAGIEAKQNKVMREVDNLAHIRQSFDLLIKNNECNIIDAQENQKTLLKIKQEYENFIESLMTNKQEAEQAQLKENENKRLKQENIRLQKELEELRADYEKVQKTVKNGMDRRPSSPSNSLIQTEKRALGLKCYDSPPLTKHGNYSAKGDSEADQLREIILRQQATINTLRKKEAKIMKLIYIIKKSGIDVEKIYNEEVKEKLDSLGYEDTIPTVHKAKASYVNEKGIQEKVTERDSEEKEDLVSHMSLDDDLELKEMKSSGASADGEAMSQSKLDPNLKNKLKLDFTALKGNLQPGKQVVDKGNLGSEDLAGFHEEFMSKFEEFSLSWRQATKMQKNI